METTHSNHLQYTTIDIFLWRFGITRTYKNNSTLTWYVVSSGTTNIHQLDMLNARIFLLQIYVLFKVSLQILTDNPFIRI